MPHVTAAKAAGETPVFPRMIQVIVAIIAARIVPNPLPVRVYMRSVRVTLFVIERSVFFGGMRCIPHRRWAVSRNILVRSFLGAAGSLLRKCGNRNQQQCCKEPDNCFCFHLLLQAQISIDTCFLALLRFL